MLAVNSKMLPGGADPGKAEAAVELDPGGDGGAAEVGTVGHGARGGVLTLGERIEQQRAVGSVTDAAGSSSSGKTWPRMCLSNGTIESSRSGKSMAARWRMSRLQHI
jgi:hypothetical protein